jgi:hypothetical protein
MNEVHEFVDGHRRQGGGRMLAIVGTYGAGKSHLASQVVRQWSDAEGGPLACVVRLRPQDTVYDIYLRIFEYGHTSEADTQPGGGIKMVDVHRRVAEIYADLKRELAFRDVPPGAVPPGRSWPVMSGDLELLRALQDRLLAIVGDREFACGLSLLLHADHDIVGQAWAWLRGGPVTTDLDRRGVTVPIENEERAKVAMLALARLLNRSAGRFALVVDDVEQLGDYADTRHRMAAVLGDLARWTADSGALLVVAVLARTWQRVPEGVLQRVGRIIRPDPFSTADIASYVDAVYSENPDASRPPFQPAAIERLHDITGGSPRQVVDACYHAAERVGGSEQVTASLIERVSVDIFAHTPPGVVAADISGVCAALGQRAVERPVPGRAAARLWVPADANGAGIMIVISGPVVTSAAATRLIRLAGKSGGTAGTEAVLVCAGPLAGSLDGRLRNAFSSVLRADDDDFLSDVSVLIGSLTSSLGKQAEVAVLHELRDELHRLQVRDYQLGRDLAKLREEQEQRLRVVIREEARRSNLRLPGADALDFGDRLPGLQALFDEALSPIRAALERVEQLWRSMFMSPEPTRLVDRSRAPGARGALPSDLTRESMVPSLGVLMTLDNLLRGFGHAVIGHIQAGEDHIQVEEEELKRARKALVDLCGRLDQTIEDVIRLIPAADDATSAAVYRVLGLDRGLLLARLTRLGSRTYDEIYIWERGSR